MPRTLVRIAVFMAALAAASACAQAVLAMPHQSLIGDITRCRACHVGGSGAATDDGCVGCHVAGGDGKAVYSGDLSRYDATDGFGHERASVTCIDCHSIHGPWFPYGGLQERLLKETSCQPEAIAEVDLGSASPARVLSVWCTGCHDRWPRPLENIPDAFVLSITQDSHSMEQGYESGYGQADVAWKESGTCVSCHAATGFPHDAVRYDAMLVAARDARAATVAPSGRASDGVCLRCHRDGRGNGVGLSF